MTDLKQEIINLLKGGGLSSTKISTELKEGYWKVINKLNELESENKIEKWGESKYQTYWKIKDD